MEFQVGETHSGYEFLDVLKRSKNGVEFRVKNTLAGRIEALRAISEGNDPEQSERFLREIRLHAGLVHPNIVTMFHAAELGNHLVITTELVEGLTVADRVARGPLSWPEAVAITRQMLSAVGYAHQQGIVHRNITPENIITGPAGIMKLASFTLAKGTSSPKLTQVGVAIGNLKYISPEQIKGLGEVDGRSDLYSLGMVLYEMLCGRPAFVMESEFEVMAAQVGAVPVAPDELNPNVPREFGPVLFKALAKNPADRYQTAAEFDQALVKVCEVRKTTAVEPVPVAVPAVDEPATPAIAATVPEEPRPVPEPPTKPTIVPRLEFPPAVLQPLPVSPFPAAPDAPVLSRRQIIIASAAGASTGVLLAMIWLFVK
jgi:eukaryotic-like serine/threonine-protein kinase